MAIVTRTFGSLLTTFCNSDLNETVRVALCKIAQCVRCYVCIIFIAIGTRVMLIKMWTEFKYSYFLPSLVAIARGMLVPVSCVIV